MAGNGAAMEYFGRPTTGEYRAGVVAPSASGVAGGGVFIHAHDDLAMLAREK